MKELKHIGVYGLVIEQNKILLIKKYGGPYDGKLDLPGGTIEFMEKPIDTLKREFMEEVGIDVICYNLYDVDSVNLDFKYNDNLIKIHHIGVFYKVLEYKGNIKNKIDIDSINDDSAGAEFYDIDKLNKNDLSLIAILELEKLGYDLNE